MAFRPMSDSLFLTAIIGLLVVGISTMYGRIPLSWGFTLILLAFIFIIASFVSITPQEKELN